MYAAEDRLWWYLGLRENALALLGLERAREPGRCLRILDAGCGTGGMAAHLRPFGTLAGVGFAPERLTHWNSLLLPVVAAARALSRRRGHAAAAARSDVTVPPAPLNWALLALIRLEGRLLRRVDLPAGSSILCVARKR